MPTHFRNAWLRTLLDLGLVLAAGAIASWVLRQWWPLLLAALGVVAWHYWRLRGVLMRLTARQRAPAPRGDGIWNELDRLLYRSQAEMRTRKRRLMQMLRAYRAAAAVLPDAIVVVERNSQRVQWFNEAATPLLGLRHPRDVGRALGEALQPLAIPYWLAAGRHAEPMQDVPSPADATVRLNLVLLPYSEDLWLLVARDVTKLLRLEEMRRDFVANVSHELRTPLTVVHGYLEMLDADDLPAEEREQWAPLLDEMRRQSRRMTQLVEDLLTLSRLEAHDTLAEEVVPMAGMLATLRREAEALSQRRHQVTLDVSSQADLRGSAKELHSAFSNLVSNAVRYTPSDGRIAIRYADDEDGGVAFSVTDSGYGIPAAHLLRVTERFYRVSTSRSRELGGTGLGLSIVKHVLGRHQARLEVDSEVGRGSRFACVFPTSRVVRGGPRHAAAPALPLATEPLA